MLREAHSASSDDARLDHDNAVHEAAFDGSPPEVYAAALRRAQRLPEPGIMKAAWASLSLDVRDRVGAMALAHSFYSRTLWKDDYRYLAGEGGNRCEAWADGKLSDIEALFAAALPQLYGTPETEPLWTQHDNVAVVFPALSHPSPLTAAIAAHLEAERALAEALGAPEEDVMGVAEDRAYHAVLAVQPRDRADLVALLEHLSRGCDDPAEEPLARALDALRLALQLDVTGA